MNRTIDYRHFPTPDQVWEWQTTMQDFAARLTGSAGHRRLINYFADELHQMGLAVCRDTYYLRPSLGSPQVGSLGLHGKRS